ncbi:MAG: YwiC-like family protein [Hydrococcus sp. C42_A2020_068]|nr:YwiC-like family protein [Hydrococcus sp. C42_A2020_068]
MTSIQSNSSLLEKPVTRNHQAWYRPMFSPEHGVYIVLAGSFLAGAALAQAWTLSSTLALVAAFCGFQAEYPLALQLKQRKSLKPRFWVWGGLYGSVALGISFWLALSAPLLLWLYAGAIAALLVDIVEVLRKERKSIVNELVTLAAVSLSAPFAYAATTGTLTPPALGLWVLNALYFSSSIFTVKLRKPQTSSLMLGIIYHAIATALVAVLYWLDWLPPIAALAFAIAPLKFGIAAWNLQWCRHIKIQFVAMLETGGAFVFLIVVTLSLLPARLTGL